MTQAQKMSTENRHAYEHFWLGRASYQDEIQRAEQKGEQNKALIIAR